MLAAAQESLQTARPLANAELAERRNLFISVKDQLQAQSHRPPCWSVVRSEIAGETVGC